MGSYRLTPRATEDLQEIWRSVSVHSERAADALFLRILEKLKRAAEYPKMGVARPDVSPNARILVEGMYIVIYEPEPYGVAAISIVHGMQAVENWLA